ncbi:MAG: right-handed parallel beta-helix repeat-containing protein [Myxococcales bacterium]|nr:right-handed parallel beta-helix repeat-containing protein [Myxococcales bacterium]
MQIERARASAATGWGPIVALLMALGCGDDGGSADGQTGSSSAGPTDEGPGTSEGPSTGPADDTDGSDGTGSDDTGEPPGDEEPTPAHLQECDGSPPGSILVADPTNYRDQLDAMQPGDVLQLAAGTYDQGLPISGMNGSAGACFVIEGPATGAPAVLTGSSSRNTVSIRDSSYVVIRNLELDGIGELGDAVKAEGDASYAHHIVLEGLYIHDHAADQQVVGISSKCPAWSWVIRNNWIESTGTGVYLGNSDGSAPFVAGLLEHNVVLDTTGYNMQIKQQNPRPDLAGLSEHDTTIIRHNVFSKLANGSVAEARPNLLLGHWPTSGPGVDDLYEVYGNFFHENPTEALMQAEGNVAIHGNVFVNGSGPGLVVQPHNDVPRRIEVFLNTFVTTGAAARITGGDPGFAQRFVGNAAFGDPALTGGEQIDDHTGTFADATAVLAAPTGVLGGGLDLHPQPGQLADGWDTSGLEAFMWWDRDFDGRPRDAGIRGAYAGPADAGAWSLDRDRKP